MYMYHDPSIKTYNFLYKNTTYLSGTKLIYDGKCFLNNRLVILNNVMVTWLYYQYGNYHFEYNNQIYTCPTWEFNYRIVKIIPVITKETNYSNQTHTKKKKEIYWTEDMVAKTIWYILIMLVGVIFHARIYIWVFATIIWYISTFKNKK